jgi:FtsZ-binding cell division protein ZapB
MKKINFLLNQIEELKKENEKLKEENESIRQATQTVIKYNRLLGDVNHKESISSFLYR